MSPRGNCLFAVAATLIGVSCLASSQCAEPPHAASPRSSPTVAAPNIRRPLNSTLESGLLCERTELWEQNRLWSMLTAEDGYMLAGFESRPGHHPWQGEHVGKWLHAATLANERTQDEKLGRTLKSVVDRLLATQEPNGYLGTYRESERFYRRPAAVNWDVWTHRYNLYGLLTYERFHPDERIVTACCRMADLLIEAFGEGKADITRNGTRCGISSMTVLESIMMLYERTRKERFLRFAEHLVNCSEQAPRLRLMSAMLDKQDVSGPGEGKAYQLMANLLGYALLYQHTGDEKYLKTVRNGWENIRADHLYVTGGPWSIQTRYNGNRECFALPKDFAPAEAVVETCSTTTWIQLNLHLLELTGEAKYAQEAERALFNALIAAQSPVGVHWCYYTKANQDSMPFTERIMCCASSGPRALEMYVRHRIGAMPGIVSFVSLTSARATLPEAFGSAELEVTGDYPLAPRAEIRFEKASGRRFALEFIEPSGARLASARVNGEEVTAARNERGFYRVEQDWKSGDRMMIEFEYLLVSHSETPKDGTRWIAFTYGPWALAQEMAQGADVTEPFAGKGITPKSATQWLAPVAKSVPPQFRIKDTDILLGPFYAAGSNTTGPRTYFRY